MYKELQTRAPNLQWAYALWDKAANRVFLAMLNRLQTKDILCKLGVIQEDGCLICGIAAESTMHLFGECKYSKECFDRILDWLEIRPACKNILRMLAWNKRKNDCSKGKKRLINGALSALCHTIWTQRNFALWEGKVHTIDYVVNVVKQAVKNRCYATLNKDGCIVY